jgi:hypothetical protein
MSNLVGIHKDPFLHLDTFAHFLSTVHQFGVQYICADPQALKSNQEWIFDDFWHPCGM